MQNDGELVYTRSKAQTEVQTHYCPGCSHGIIHKLIGESLDELDMGREVVMIAPVGCSVLLYNYFKGDAVEAAHGRAAAVATGIKRALPDKLVISYQGDGDLLAIGMGETIHAANRGENITVIFVNNAIYGMTGGQMAPTTLPGQVATTAPFGRNPDVEGYPIRACEMLNTLDKPVFIERCSTHDVKHIMKAKKAIKKALTYQKEGKGYSFVELLSTCPTNWGKTPVDSMKFVEEVMVPYYPCKNFRDVEAE